MADVSEKRRAFRRLHAPARDDFARAGTLIARAGDLQGLAEAASSGEIVGAFKAAG